MKQFFLSCDDDG